MGTSQPPARDASRQALRERLQHARAAARLSQLALSLRLGVSQRHVSYVESGRAQPSRELLVAWLDALGAPLGVRNAAMLEAGYAPVYSAAPLADPSLRSATQALAQLLAAHEPMPAWVIDAAWNVLEANEGARWLLGALLPQLCQPRGTAALNLLDLMAAADGLPSRIRNLREVGPPMLSHLRAEAQAHPSLRAKVDAFAGVLTSRLGPTAAQRLPAPAAPVLTTRFASEYGDLSFFTMLTTFGTPQDITLASLRVEHMFAADAATADILRTHVLAQD
jgi:transcriptional regulator with XRE-family HTH domain